MSECCLPHEIVVEILHRLPPKSLVRCTLVCKSWRSLVTHPSFISEHLRRPIDHYLLFHLWTKRDCPNHLRYSLRRDDDFLTDFSTLDLPRCFGSEFSVVGICNGLVCITIACYRFIVCNPCIRRFVYLPETQAYPHIHDACAAFGFDSGTNDYKVVSIGRMTRGQRHDVELYSLATGFWKNITTALPGCFVCANSPHAFIDGIVHWGAQRRVEDDSDDSYWFILSFDFEDEVFGEIMLPQSLVHVSSMDAVTVIGGGNSLAVYNLTYYPGACTTIWVMKEYGAVDSWNKLCTFDWMGFYLEAPLLRITLTGISTDLPKVISCRNNGEVLLFLENNRKGCLYSLDAERERFTDLKIEGEEYTLYFCRYYGYYADSLVLLDRVSGLESY